MDNSEKSKSWNLLLCVQCVNSNYLTPSRRFDWTGIYEYDSMKGVYKLDKYRTNQRTHSRQLYRADMRMPHLVGCHDCLQTENTQFRYATWVSEYSKSTTCFVYSLQLHLVGTQNTIQFDFSFLNAFIKIQFWLIQQWISNSYEWRNHWFNSSQCTLHHWNCYLNVGSICFDTFLQLIR